MTDFACVRREYMAATIAAAISDGLFNPLYVLQNRAQIDPKTRVSSLARSAISKHGVFAGLWAPGLTAMCMRGGFAGIRVGLYPMVREALPGSNFGTRLLAGSITGSVGMLIFNPVEVVRVRMSGPKPYANTLVAFIQVARGEGLITGLWRGIGASAARAGIYSGSQLACYDTTKRTLIRCRIFGDDGPATHLGASFVSGVSAQTVCQPVDTLKTVLQNSRGTPKGAVAAFKELVSAGGLSRLYRGLLPAIMCKGPVVMLFLPLVEQLRRCFGLEYI